TRQRENGKAVAPRPRREVLEKMRLDLEAECGDQNGDRRHAPPHTPGDLPRTPLNLAVGLERHPQRPMHGKSDSRRDTDRNGVPIEYAAVPSGCEVGP